MVDKRGTRAFPCDDAAWAAEEMGLTKRELFAAMFASNLAAAAMHVKGDQVVSVNPDVIAAESVEYADALLAELAKPVKA